MQTELRGLNETQARMFLKARTKAVREDVPVHITLDELDGTPEDKAVVAERFTPGAGKGYLQQEQLS